MRKVALLSILISFQTSAQVITGLFSGFAGQQVKLSGYDGFNTYVIDSAVVNENGMFQINFNTKDYGIGFLNAKGIKDFMVILAPDENLVLACKTFSDGISITSGKQNLLFEQYASEHARREQTLSAWDYLEKIYSVDSVFKSQNKPRKAILEEKQRIKSEDRALLTGLNPQSYISWYLPLRNLINSVSTIAQYRTEEIPATIASFRSIDYTDSRLYKSGLLSDAIEAHFWLIENSGRSLDSVFNEMNVSIDHIIENITPDEKKFNEIAAYMFKLLERRSLLKSSEYLALKVLNQRGCSIDNNFASQLESYRAMKIGNTAPDFDIKGDYFAPGLGNTKMPAKLSGIKSKYTAIIFGAGWCPNCPGELYQLKQLYEKWKNQQVEVVFISLDENREVFKNFTSIFPFISICDYQKWDSPVVQAYHVFATPTMFLLDNNLKIILKPSSVMQADAWLDWSNLQ
jgi:thiol-disulfide isomerase/thioredoxin